MDINAGPLVDDSLDPPARMFDRLRQIAGYTWDETQRPLHTSYDNCPPQPCLEPFTYRPLGLKPDTPSRRLCLLPNGDRRGE
ncbi:hypothetical protein SPBR_04017 [Sporothrix brasiliensis 5110]|uniref:Uncharacterized protein n=1 Tax=Sporothrix brasiliensis 5110 TaxID=1398154 RepID=A0A0C2J896_9PEZI|nr:uncharacterized protein SPBR_04017 [Sporothrix brasiliensis 5110]KIH95235.1 hypothetical protein SPBR_04017 [Sporothrix brasiliensis 5110]